MKRSRGGGDGQPGIAPQGGSFGTGEVEEGRSQIQGQPRLTGLGYKLGHRDGEGKGEGGKGKRKRGGNPVTTMKSLWIHN